MIGLDTNVLVRLVTEDDRHQAETARREMEQAIHAGHVFLVSLPVLCELIWVLSHSYRFERDQQAEVIERLLASAEITFDRREIVRGALGDFRAGNADYADYVVGRIAAHGGAEATLTFDRRLAGEAGFRLLD